MCFCCNMVCGVCLWIRLHSFGCERPTLSKCTAVYTHTERLTHAHTRRTHMSNVGILAVLPFWGAYLVCLPPCLELWLLQDKPVSGVCVCVLTPLRCCGGGRGVHVLFCFCCCVLHSHTAEIQTQNNNNKQ